MRPTLAALCTVFLGCGFHTTGELENAANTTTATTTALMPTSTGDTTTSATGSGGGTSSTSSAIGVGGSGGTIAAGGAGTGGATSAGGSDAGPTMFASCKALHDARPSDPSGVYDITPAGGNAYRAYCDMTANNGGWTLALKVDGASDTFDYDKPVWTNATGLNEDKPDLDAFEAKLASFWSVPIVELRLGMIDANVTRWVVVSLAGESLLAILAGHAKTNLGKDNWKGLLASGSIQTKCNWEGINVLDRVRIGLLGDESDDCQTSPSPDSFIGFGGKLSFDQVACGNRAGYWPDNGDRNTPTFGYVLVR